MLSNENMQPDRKKKQKIVPLANAPLLIWGRL